MAKKRVHEIAKELKARGVELDNKAVVAELKGLGYDVKSHSSSIDDDQARQAIEKIIAKHKPDAAPKPVAAKGFLVRRKGGGTEVKPPPAGAKATPPVKRTAAAPAVRKSSTTPATTTPASTPSAPMPQVAASAEKTASVPMASQASPAAQSSAGAAVAMSPEADVKTEAPVKEAPAAEAKAEPAKPPAPKVDPRTLKPTATQAVVISRPLIPVKPVTPTDRGGGVRPRMGGQVREFKVVPDHLGRGGREFVDVSKNKNERARQPRRTTNQKQKTFNPNDLRDQLFGRGAIAMRGKKRKATKKGQKTQITEMAAEKKVIRIEDGITVSDLSQTMGVKVGEIIKKLMSDGNMVTANHMLDVDSAELLATDYGWRVERVGHEVEDHLPDVEENPADMVSRPPVVTVMGHVDHGKTSLLDAIRKANVVAGEAGGITQHIGAYTVKVSKGDITFIDTPGHAAFTAMRARGANITDVVILVVAADDGVMPQTSEAIAHAKAAGVPIVVAVNKMDVGGANPDRVKTQLSEANLVAEDWGGDVIMVPVSAKTKDGIDSLLESVLLQAELLELKANANKPGVGVVIEAKLEKGRGPVATVLVKEGTLKKGDPLVSGGHNGRVRMMINDRGEPVKEVGPGYSAEVVGLSGVPVAGDAIHAVGDEKAAKDIASHRVTKNRRTEMAKSSTESLDDLFAKMKEGEAKLLNVVLKADVQGSAEAVAQAIEKLSNEKVKVSIVHKGVGALTESDVMLASAGKGVVLGFNVRPESGAEATAKKHEVNMQTFSIIYELIEATERLMEGLLEPIRTEKRLGRAEVRTLFNVPKLGTVAGVAVIDGVIKRSAKVRLVRDNRQVYEGKMASLRRFKDDVREVEKGFECGIGIENYQDIKPGDIIEAFELEEKRASLN